MRTEQQIGLIGRSTGLRAGRFEAFGIRRKWFGHMRPGFGDSVVPGTSFGRGPGGGRSTGGTEVLPRGSTDDPPCGMPVGWEDAVRELTPPDRSRRSGIR